MTFHQRLRGVWQASRSLVCVGIDPELEKIPEHLRDYEEPLLEFGKGIVDGTAPFVTGKDAATIVEEKGLKQVSDSGAIEAMIDEVIAANGDKVEEYRGGKDKLFGFFVGQVMKASKGQANPSMVNQLLRAKLDG